MDLLHLCLVSIYFQYNGKHYKHLHGTAMGSPYFRRCGWNSHAKHWEGPTNLQSKTPFLTTLRWRYNHCCTHKKNWWITQKLEQNNQGDRGEWQDTFPDCLVTREYNTLRTTIYRKPTHTVKLLDETSYNPPSVTTVRTLARRAQLVCDSHDTLHTRDLRNRSGLATTLQHPSCTQTHVLFTTLSH